MMTERDGFAFPPYSLALVHRTSFDRDHSIVGTQ